MRTAARSAITESGATPPGVDVREVDLGDRHRDQLERVADRPTVVRPGAGVDDHAVAARRRAPARAAARPRPLVVGLEAATCRTRRRARDALTLTLELVERDRPVVRRVAAARACRGSRRAAARARSASRQPLDHLRLERGRDRTPGAGAPRPSQQHVPDAVRSAFLSRPSGSHTSGPTPSSARGSPSRRAALAALAPVPVEARELAATATARAQPEPDRLPVRVAREAGRRLDGVADGVAEVEHGAGAGLLTLVAAPRRSFVARRCAAIEVFAARPAERPPAAVPASVQHPAAGEQPVLDHLGQPAAQLADAAAWPARRGRPAPAAAGRRRRRSSCPRGSRRRPCRPPASTCASSVVGTCTRRTPRWKVAAAKPARSPTTPPPSATTRSVRRQAARRTRTP